MKPEQAPDMAELARSRSQLSVPGFNAFPACRCGKELRRVQDSGAPLKGGARIRIYTCAACHHQMRLTVWAADMVA
jgi:hypothetical protein